MADDTTSILVRLSPEMAAKLKERAKADHRSVNGTVLVALERLLSERRAA